MSPKDWNWGVSYVSRTSTSTSPSASPFPNASNMLQSTSLATFSGDQLPQQPNLQPQSNITHAQIPHAFPFAQPKTSRKRSRDEMIQGYNDLDSDSSNSSIAAFPSARPTPSPPKREVASNQQPVMGPGMTLIYPDEHGQNPGAQMDAASQTGTWAEELSERLKSSSMHEAQRPSLESRKSLRLDREAADKMDDVASAAVEADPRVKLGFGSETKDESNGPTIDEASYTLGIGWSCVPSNPTMDAATRGWARHIEARFPLQSVRFVWVNRALPAYLVTALIRDGRERKDSLTSQLGVNGQQAAGDNHVAGLGYYLFDESLSQGRLVSMNWERALQNLRSSPIVFDGDRILESAESANQATRDTFLPPIHSLSDPQREDGLMTDVVTDADDDPAGKAKNAISLSEAKYWAGWGKSSIPPIYPLRSLNSCSPFENKHQQQRIGPLIEVGGASGSVGGGDGMDLDF